MNDIIFRVIVPDNKILFKTLMIKGERGLQGTSIVSIEKTQTIGLTDYYTISLNDGTTYEFTVQNGTNSYFDDEFSLVSENAVQNKVITAALNTIGAALASIQQYDNALSLSSENAVQNKVVKAALDLKANSTALNSYYTKSQIDTAFNNLGASNIGYNNASSDLSATDTQAAIDEIVSGKLNRLDITSLVTFAESVTGTSTIIYYKMGVLYIFYQGESKAHASGDLLFTLPSGYRPDFIKYVTFVASNGVNFIFGDAYINIDGKCAVNQISDTSGAGRIYFTVAIPLI